MQHKPVQHALQAHFNLDPRRLEFIARFVIVLLKVRTVNLAQIAGALNGRASLESNAKRARRFLEFKLAQDVIARFVLYVVPGEKLVVCMDRTTWKFGTLTINFLVIGIAYHGIALPIAWVKLDKDGNSKVSERLAVLERVSKLVPASRILGYAADEIYASLREYAHRTRTGFAIGDNKAFVVDLPDRKSLGPDAAFHTGPMSGVKFYQGAPVFAVEVRSEGDYGPFAEKEIAKKRADYFAAGTLIVWDVDLLSLEVVRAYHASDPDKPLIYRRGDSANAEPAVPGWAMPVDELFAYHPTEQG